MRGKLLSKSLLFDMAFAEACTAAGLVDSRPLPARTPAEGPCECDLVLTCSKFLTTIDYTPRLKARLTVEHQLINDATARGRQREIERHQRAVDRLTEPLQQLAGHAETKPADSTITTPEGRRQ